MYAMHHQLPLPADYDMDIIRVRVADRGEYTDDFPGLRFKAYLMRTVESGGQNEYAPFYLWDNTDDMGNFLWGGKGFSGIVRDFGRPPVQTWAGVRTLRGKSEYALFATKETFDLGQETDPAALLPRLLESFAEATADEQMYSTTLAIDPRSWQAVILTLGASQWDDLRPIQEPWNEAKSTKYEVLHLSEPIKD